MVQTMDTPEYQHLRPDSNQLPEAGLPSSSALIGGVHVTTGGATGGAVETSGSGGTCIDIAEVNSANGMQVRI